MGTQTGWQPDWGWGELDLASALAQRTNFAEGSVPAGSARLYAATPQSAGDRATLAWNRRASGCVDPGCTPTALTLTNLDLKQLNAATCAVQASSTSTLDNVEQVRAPGGSTGQQVLYDVRASSTVSGLGAEPFGLASTQALTPLASPAASVVLTRSTPQLKPGEDLTVQATVANPSPDLTGEQASVTLNLPSGVQLVSGTQTQQLGTLNVQGQAGQQATATWVVRATSDGTYNLTATTDAQHCDEHFADLGTTQFAAGTPQAPPNNGGNNNNNNGGGNTGNPGTQPPKPTTPAPPKLHVAKKAWTSKGLKVSGTVASKATGHVTIVYTARSHGKRVTVRKRAAVRSGHFTAVLKVPRRLKGVKATVTVRYSGDDTYRPQSIHAQAR